MMLDVAGLFEKHQSKGVLVDTNLLVLYLVGKVNKNRILNFKRTQKHTVEDFELLERAIVWFGSLVTTPHVLGQVSDLATLHGNELSAVRNWFKLVVGETEERYEESRNVVKDACFERLGLTDAAIALLCGQRTLMLTDDLDLYDTLSRRGVDAVNFNHIRHWAWR